MGWGILGVAALAAATEPESTITYRQPTTGEAREGGVTTRPATDEISPKPMPGNAPSGNAPSGLVELQASSMDPVYSPKPIPGNATQAGGTTTIMITLPTAAGREVGGTVNSAEKMQQVPVQEINVKYILIGRLAQPLGTFMTISGVAEREAMQGKPLLVDTINGVKMTEPIRVAVEDVKGWSVGTRYTLRGYESYGMRGTAEDPQEIKADTPRGQQPLQLGSWFVVTRIEPAAGEGGGK